MPLPLLRARLSSSSPPSAIVKERISCQKTGLPQACCCRSRDRLRSVASPKSPSPAPFPYLSAWAAMAGWTLPSPSVSVEGLPPRACRLPRLRLPAPSSAAQRGKTPCARGRPRPAPSPPSCRSGQDLEIARLGIILVGILEDGDTGEPARGIVKLALLAGIQPVFRIAHDGPPPFARSFRMKNGVGGMHLPVYAFQDVALAVFDSAHHLHGLLRGKRLPRLHEFAVVLVGAEQHLESAVVLCSDRLFTLSSFSKLEVARLTNKQVWKRVNSHKNAKLTPRGREEMVRRLDSMPAAAIAAGFGVSLRTARKWKSRYRHGGVEALVDKSSRPLRCRSKLTEKTCEEIFSLRRKRLTGDEIASRLERGRSSVFRALRKLGCSRLTSLEAKPPVRRYQWEKPGQMLHLDIKRLGRIDGVGHRKAGTRQVYRRRPGWEYLHVCIDDASRVAYTAIHPDETAESAVEFLWHAVA